MTLSFQNFNLSDLLLDGLDTMGFNNPTPIQEQVIPHILRGADVIACAQTGTGKTAAYLLPVLDKISKDELVNCFLILYFHVSKFRYALRQKTFFTRCNGSHLQGLFRFQ